MTDNKHTFYNKPKKNLPKEEKTCVFKGEMKPLMSEEEKSQAQILDLTYDFSCRIIRFYKYLKEGKLSKADRGIIDTLGRQLVRSATYNDDGTVIDSVVLGQEDGIYGVDIPKNVWHKLEAIESSVIFECKEGPYVPHEVEGILTV